MINEAVYAQIYQLKARQARASGNAEARRLWNPNRPWRNFTWGGGHPPDEKTVACRKAFIATLKKHGPLRIGQIHSCIPFGEKTVMNVRSWLLAGGEIVASGHKGRFVYSLASEQQQ